MSFLTTKHEPLAELDEVLAFLETVDTNTNTNDFATVSTDDRFDAVCQQDHSNRLKKLDTKSSREKKKRVRSPASSSTVLQRRRRAEILSLRQQVEELKSFQMEFIISGHIPTAPKLNCTKAIEFNQHFESLSQWQQRAVRQYDSRQQAEEINRELRAIWARQRKISNTLNRILHKGSKSSDKDFILGIGTKLGAARGLMVDSIPMCITQLEHAVQQVYCSGGVEFDVSGVCSSFQTSYKEQRQGNMVEFVTNTPINCSIKQAGSMIWRYLGKQQTRGRTSSSLQQIVTLMMTADMKTFRFEKINFMHKFQEDDRIVLVWSSLIFLPSMGLKFTLKGYSTITRPPEHPNTGCTVRTAIKLRVDNTAAQSAENMDSIALGALRTMIRTFLQSEQFRLAEEADCVRATPYDLVV